MAPMPGGAMPMPRPMKRGTPKVVPVIVSAGLAVGVFCGLLFGVGTGKDEASASTTPPKGSVMSDDSAAPEGLGATAAMPAPPKNGPAAPVAPAPAPAVGSGSATATVAAPTIKTVKLVVAIKPEAAAKDAKVTVDGKEIDGTSVDLPSEKKNVRVVVTSNGFHSWDKQVDLSGDRTDLDVELPKKPTSSGGGSPGFGGASHTAPTIPKAPPGEKKPKKPAGGGVIDI